MPTLVVYARMKKLMVATTLAAIVSMGGFTTAAFSDDIADWRKKVSKRIAKKHIYPRSAISREIEGKARVRVTMLRTGEIAGFEIIQPSGESILDKAIPKMMGKLSPLPAPPDSMPDDKLVFVIPITWRLQ